MKVRHSSFLVAVAGLALAAGMSMAQEKVDSHGHVVTQPPATVAVSNGAKVDFNQLTHEFGVISDEKEVEAKFKFTNSGTEELEIINLQGSCGCTVPALAKKKYAPGESGEIAVKYNPHNRRGKQHTNVTVTTNVADKQQVVLGLQSEVKPTVLTEPQVATLGQIEKGKEGKTTLTITSRKLDLIVTQVTPNDAKVNATIGEKKEVEIEGEKAIQFPIEITLAAAAPVGQIQTQCIVRTNDPQRTLNFMVLGEVVGQVKVEPQRITLGGLTPGQDINTSFRVTSRAGQALNLIGATEAPATMPAPNKPEGAPGAKMFDVKFVQDTASNPPAWVVTLTGKAPADGSTFRGDIVLKTNMAGEEEVKVPYYGFIRQKPRPVPTTTPAGQPSPSLLVPD
jgi:hypothetical protein